MNRILMMLENDPNSFNRHSTQNNLTIYSFSKNDSQVPRRNKHLLSANRLHAKTSHVFGFLFNFVILSSFLHTMDTFCTLFYAIYTPSI